MADSLYLAMTAAEMYNHSKPDHKVAYMACHFSPYGTGLSNFPEALPPEAILIVNDRTPICGHDPQKICEQLSQVTTDFHCSSVLLDFQRPGEKQTANLCSYLVQNLSCSIGVSHFYAEGSSCPVFVPPLPLGCILSDHLSPWNGREIWLDMAVESECFVVTPQGCSRNSCPPPQGDTMVSREHYCHYQFQTYPDRAEFILHRSREMLLPLMEEAATLGVTQCIGLYQQLK